MSDDAVRIEITPEPSPQELAAIAAAVSSTLAQAAEPVDTAPRVQNPWREAGKREALRTMIWEKATW